MSKPSSPASAIVGSSGASFERCGGGHGERLQLARLDLRRGVGEIVEHELDVAGEQRLRRRRAALVGNVDDVGAGVDLEQLAGEVPLVVDHNRLAPRFRQVAPASSAHSAKRPRPKDVDRRADATRNMPELRQKGGLEQFYQRMAGVPVTSRVCRPGAPPRIIHC